MKILDRPLSGSVKPLASSHPEKLPKQSNHLPNALLLTSSMGQQKVKHGIERRKTEREREWRREMVPLGGERDGSILCPLVVTSCAKQVPNTLSDCVCFEPFVTPTTARSGSIHR